YKMLCIQKPDDMQLEQRKTALYKLLESMSNSLGYKDEISWDDIQSPYIPKAMYDSINNTAIVQQGIANIVQQMNTNIQLPQTQPNEETTHPKAETSLKESAT
ncbi:MAG: hypothetical protein IIZ19_08075, partial [Clostridia bacterium]|nr:hypothetical protein [Clostridia bacterium]